MKTLDTTVKIERTMNAERHVLQTVGGMTKVEVEGPSGLLETESE